MKKKWSVTVIADDPFNGSHMTFEADSVTMEGDNPGWFNVLIIDGLRLTFSEGIERLEEIQC